MSLSYVGLVAAVQLPASVAAQYTCPSGTAVVVKHVVFTNTTAGGVTVTAYVVPSGGALGNAAKVLDAFSITAHTAYVSPELAGVALNAGDSLQCFAGASASISMNASGFKQT
ncbi:MAG: hypothetical protein ACREDR_00305 [Blastocatellia bacterium]